VVVVDTVVVVVVSGTNGLRVARTTKATTRAMATTPTAPAIATTGSLRADGADFAAGIVFAVPAVFDVVPAVFDVVPAVFEVPSVFDVTDAGGSASDSINCVGSIGGSMIGVAAVTRAGALGAWTGGGGSGSSTSR
jgi:hypothetical protein